MGKQPNQLTYCDETKTALNSKTQSLRKKIRWTTVGPAIDKHRALTHWLKIWVSVVTDSEVWPTLNLRFNYDISYGQGQVQKKALISYESALFNWSSVWYIRLTIVQIKDYKYSVCCSWVELFSLILIRIIETACYPIVTNSLTLP